MATADQLRQERDLASMTASLGRAERRVLEALQAKPLALPQAVLNGLPCKLYDEKWFIHFPIHSQGLREVWWGNKVYEVPDAKRQAFDVSLYMFVRKNQQCILGSVCTLNTNLYLPHIDSSSACMGAAHAPSSMLTEADYAAVHAILTRHVEGIQLDSLFTSQGWPQAIQDALPQQILDWIGDQCSDNARAMRGLFKEPQNVFNLPPEDEPDPEPDEYEAEYQEAYAEEEPREEDRPEINPELLGTIQCNCDWCRQARGESVAVPMRGPIAVASDIWEVEAQ